MADDNLLKEILDSLTDADAINLFAAANGLTGDTDVVNRLKELEWNKHVDDLWEEILLDLEPLSKKSRQLTNDQPSTSCQSGGGEEIPKVEKPYFIWKKDTRTFKKNLARDTSFKVKFNDQWRGEKLVDIYNKLHNMFDDVLSQARGHDADLGRVVVSHPNLNNPIVVPLQSWQNLHADTVMSEITKVLNSNETIPVDEHLLVTVGSIDLPKGGSWSGNKLAVTSLFGPNNTLKRKKSVLYVENDNDLCLPIAIGLCFMKICKKVSAESWSHLIGNDSNTIMDHVIQHRTVPKHYYGNLLKKSRRKYQTEMATWLCKRAGVPVDRYLGLNDIEPFETLLDVNINVVSSRVGNKFVRVSKEDTEKSSLYLYHVETENEKHWHGIGNIQGFFSASYFCHLCLKPYQNKDEHTCAISCDVCLHNDCPKTEMQVGCRFCGRVCRSLACFERHRVGKMLRKDRLPPACELWHQCRKCRVKLSAAKRNPKLHVCGEWQCSSCVEYHVGEHLCYQKSTQSDPEERQKKKFIFYDFETRQDDLFQCDQGYTPSSIRCRECAKKERQCASCRLCQNCHDSSCGLQQHKVNFAVLQTSCHACEKEELNKDSTCEKCGVRCDICSQMKKSKFVRPPCPDTCGHREQIFQGERTAEQFCRYVTQPHLKNTILIAHNAKSFDLYPILEVLIDRHSIRPDKIIYNGSKIMYMHIANKLNLTFLDSLNFLPMKLAKIPEAFGLEELSKGFFPHFFNTKENQTYVGPYPALEFYGYNFMSSGERKKLATWHASKNSEVFNFQEEMLKYCRSDVDILRRGCIAFRNTVLQVTTIEDSHIQPDGTISTTTVDGVDPFDYVTIASVCMGIYKTLFLKHNIDVEVTRDQTSTWHTLDYFEGVKGIWLDGKWVALSDLEKEECTEVGKRRMKSPIAVVPSQGYVSKDNYSKISIQWLEWLMHRNRKRGTPVHIRHALNGGEYCIPDTTYRCDGFAENPNGKGTIYEFYGKRLLTVLRNLVSNLPLPSP